MKFKVIYLLVLFCLSNEVTFSQIDESLIRSELQSRGIPEDSLRARLNQKGVNPDEIDPSNFVSFQSILEETVREYEAAEKRRNAISSSNASPDTIPLMDPVMIDTPKKEKAAAQKTEPIDSDENQIYGHALFGEQGLAIKQSFDNIKAPDSYILASGDQVLISIYGRSYLSKSFRINGQGYITDEGRGFDATSNRVYLKGLTFREGREVAKRHFRNYYSFNDSEFDMTVSASRNVTVGVFGDVKNAGSIVIPANNTALNALAFANGPKETGSVRRIKLISTEGEKIIDVYKFLNDPSLISNYYIFENDVIHVPTAQKIVTINGAITRPMRYELLENEDLKKLVEYAGGLTANAFMQDVEIVRFESNQKIVANARLDQIMNGTIDYQLRNGDVVKIKSIKGNLQKAVYISGAVNNPGPYQLDNETRLSTVINKSILKPTARRDFAYVLRFQLDSTYSYERVNINAALNNIGGGEDIILSNKDRVVVIDRAEFKDDLSFSVVGAVRNPTTFNFDPSDGVKISDALDISGGILPSASKVGFVIRRDIKEPKQIKYIPFDPLLVNNSSSVAENINLAPGDVIRVIGKSNYRDDFSIRVSGAVRQPGEFEYDPNMEIKEALQLSNGLKFSAATNKIEVSRVLFSNNNSPEIVTIQMEIDRDLNVINDNGFGQMMPFDHIYVRDIPDFELQRVVYLKGEIKFPGEYSLTGDNERISSVIQRAGGLTREANAEGAALFRKQNDVGFVVVKMDRALENAESTWDIILQEGDTIFVPKQEDIVQIKGQINAKELYLTEYLNDEQSIAVGYEGSKNALYYVNEYGGGVSERGSKAKISVEQPNGQIERTKNFLFFKSYPKIQKGSKIVVGNKKKKEPNTPGKKEDVQWDKVLRDTIAQATAVLTLIILINNTSR